MAGPSDEPEGSLRWHQSQYFTVPQPDARRLLAAESARLNLPVADPMRGGAEFEQLLDNCLRGTS